ncbi:MAG: hypothetical protein GY835_16415 [bacterium]|nr:hypothetical protein [bacterium]
MVIDEADKMVEADDGSEKIPREELKLSTAEAQLREAMAEIQRLKGTSPND